MSLTCLTAALLAAATPAPRVDGDKHADAATVSTGKLVRHVYINGDHLRFRDKQHLLVWQGNVHAKRDELDLTCDRMTAHYTGDQSQITQATCDGHVVVVEGDRWGKGEHADFDNLNGMLVVTGAPEAHQGKNLLRGTKVTFFVGTDQLDVENASALVEQGRERPVLPKASRKGPSGT